MTTRSRNGRVRLGAGAAVSLVIIASTAAACVVPSSPPNPQSLVRLDFPDGNDVCSERRVPFTIINDSPWPVRVDYIGPISSPPPPPGTYVTDHDVLAPNGGRATVTGSQDLGQHNQVFYTFIGGPTTSTSYYTIGSAVEGFDGGAPQLLSTPPTLYSGILPERFCPVGSAVLG